MLIPASSRRKALAIIDVQPGFVGARDLGTVGRIRHLIASRTYDLYVNATFAAELGSIWEKQTGWFLPSSTVECTLPEVADLLPSRDRIEVHKQTKSMFRGDRDLDSLLRSCGIEEIHLVGYDINDCVMASAFDSFDRGFFTYIIEECCAPSADSDLEGEALSLLRYLNLTNNSMVEEIPVIEI